MTRMYMAGTPLPPSCLARAPRVGAFKGPVLASYYWVGSLQEGNVGGSWPCLTKYEREEYSYHWDSYTLYMCQLSIAMKIHYNEPIVFGLEHNRRGRL